MSVERTTVAPPAGTAGRTAVYSAALLLAAVLLAYSNSLDAGFHLDDYHQIVRNPSVRELSFVPGFFTKAGLGSAYEGISIYRPVAHASFALSYALTGYEVWGYHVFNIALHFINALLVFLAVGAVLREAGRDDADWASLFVALVFAVHPIQTGAVTYISGRAVLLAGFFYLSAFLCFLRFRAGAGGRYLWGALSPLFFLLGLLSKEMAVSLMAVMAAYDLLFTARRVAGRAGRIRLALYYVPFMAALSVYMLLKRLLHDVALSAGAPHGVGEYLMSEAGVLLMYVRLLLLPVNQNNDYLLPVSSSPDVRVFVSAALVAAALALLYRLRARSPELTFFGAWFFLSLAPESSLIPIIDIAVEYRLYLPSVGFIAAAVVYLAGALKRPAAFRAAVASVVILFGVLTFARNCVWADDYTLWADVVKKSPHSGRARHNYGLELDKRGRHMEAIEEFRRALETDPAAVQAYKLYNDMGVSCFRMGRFEEAARQFEAAIALQPGYLGAHENLARAYYALGRFEESEAAIDNAPKVNRENPLIR